MAAISWSNMLSVQGKAVSVLFNFEGPGGKVMKVALPFGNLRHRKRHPNVLGHGGIAQLGEHLLCKQGVKGSNPFISTFWADSSVG